MQAELGISASSPVLAEVTHCHHWSVSVCIRNRGRRANPSFSVLQQCPSVTDTGSWLMWDCLHIMWCFLAWIEHLSACKDLPGPGPCLWQQSQVVLWGGPWPLAWAAPTLVAPAADSGFLVSAIRALQQECSHPFSRDHSSYSLETGLRKLHFPLRLACPCVDPRSSSRERKP